jgi:hypothetical protein
MSEGVSIELGSLATYLEDGIRSLFGKDPETIDWINRLRRRTKVALDQAAWVQCVGMERPIPIADIYQPITLEGKEAYRSRARSNANILTLLEQQRDGIIFAGPGRGKTTLLSWLLLKLANTDGYTPLPFLLRTGNAVAELTEFVERLTAGLKAGVPRKNRIVLLVDGYDEIDEQDRKSVSEALALFRSLEVGCFYLTCRSFYDVYDLKVDHYKLAAFTNEDSYNFATAFAKCYGCTINARELLDTLKQRGLDDFATHPLMLTLICMLKTSTLPELPQNSLHLLKRAFDTLTFRWDEQKGVHRRSRIPVDGEDRVGCLMRIAYQMNGLIATQGQVEAFTRQFLKLLQRKVSVDPRQLLNEIAQWYGVLVPADGDNWQFAHRSIHDYLAARFCVERGNFDPTKVRVWNSRAAYSVCLSHDATRGMTIALEKASSIHAFTECLYNKVPFDPLEVAKGVLLHFRKYTPFVFHPQGHRATVDTSQDFTPLASDRLLVELISVSLREYPRGEDSSRRKGGAAEEVLFALALAELRRRGKVLRDLDLQRVALEIFLSGDFIFQIGIESPYKVRLGDMFQHTGWRLLPPEST